jgi:ATP-binding cassette, subfamily B, bacterial MsbA
MIAFLRSLWVYIRPYRLRLALGILFGVISGVSNGALILAVRVVVNLAFAEPGTMSFADQVATLPNWLRWLAAGLIPLLPDLSRPSRAGLVVAVLCIPAVMFLRVLSGYLNVYFTSWASVRAVADLRACLFNHLQNLSLSFFSSARTGELISRITNDTQILYQTIGLSFNGLIREPATVLVLVSLLLSQQWKLTLVSLIAMPICVVPIVVYGRKVRRSVRAMQLHSADLASLMHESFTANRIIKAYNLEGRMLDQFRRTTRDYIGQIMRTVRAHELPSQLMEFLGSMGVALVFLYVIFLFDKPMKAGDFIQFIGSVFLLYAPVKNISRMHNQLEQARAASQRVFELLALRNEVEDPPRPVPLRAAGAEIHFSRVSFSYGDKPVVRDVEFVVQPGQLVALVGASGSGKTTLTSLLMRFYDPQSGAIRIGGTDIRQVALADLRRQVALVAQETILFNDTIRSNIACGRLGATDAEIEAAARHAYAHDFIMGKPQGFDTVVGEKGIAISGGQRQRLAIARAIIKDAPILVLDEATSALDTESERQVQAALEALMVGRTTICIAHRLSTITKADVIIVLDQGRIVESGRHADLLKAGGVYQKLYELQFQA